MKKVLNVIGACLAGILCIAVVGFYPAKNHINKELTRYKLTTKIEALTEIDRPDIREGNRRTKSVPVPNIDLTTIDYDQYDDILEELQNSKDTAKADAESALANFIAISKTTISLRNSMHKSKTPQPALKVWKTCFVMWTGKKP